MDEIIRDTAVEIELQNALNRGHSVWVIGDVHGHADALENLLSEIDPNPGDRLVFLGDLIDRGPDSRMVIRIARGRSGAFVLRGNHEEMPRDGFKGERQKKWSPPLPWLTSGGKQCLDSYRNKAGELNDVEFTDDLRWMLKLPHIFVLDEWILVHAGIDPTLTLDEQTPAACLWIRSAFHRATRPVDPDRAVVFGHSMTHVHLKRKPGELANSPIQLEDGRPLWLGIETGVCDSDSGWLTGLDLSTGRLIQAKDDGTTRKKSAAFTRR